MGRTSASPKGFTAIELLIFISIFALVIAFAVPATRSVLHQSKLEQAREVAEASIQQARRTARFYKTDVLMRIESDRHPKNDAITLTVPKLQRGLTENQVREEFTLPEGVDIVSDAAIINFDPEGDVEWPATVRFVTQSTGGKVEHLKIE